MTKEDIGFLIEYCSKTSSLFNEVMNHLDEKWGIKSVELCMIVTYYINEDRKLTPEERHD